MCYGKYHNWQGSYFPFCTIAGKSCSHQHMPHHSSCTGEKEIIKTPLCRLFKVTMLVTSQPVQQCCLYNVLPFSIQGGFLRFSPKQVLCSVLTLHHCSALGSSFSFINWVRSFCISLYLQMREVIIPEQHEAEN